MRVTVRAMRSISSRSIIIGLALVVLGLSGVSGTAEENPAAIIQDLLQRTKFKGGLGVFLGFRDASAMMAAAARGNFLIHALHADWNAVERARKAVSKSGLYGIISIAHQDHPRLPYARSGKEQWRRRASGRMDTPPTVHRGRCLIGSRDGWVACLCAADGKLLWRFRAAPSERLIVAFGQLESAWPVVGGVMVVDDRAVFTAGRGNGLSGGAHAYALDLESGAIVWHARTPADAERGVMCALPHARSGIIEAGWGHTPKGKPSGWRIDLSSGNVVSPNAGTQPLPWDRSWRYLEASSGCMRFLSYVGGGQMMIQSGNMYFFYTKGGTSGRGPNSAGVIATKKLKSRTPVWKNADFQAPLQVEAFILAGKTLCVGGPRDRADASKGGFVYGLSAEDGKRTFSLNLKSAVAWEGLSAAYGRLYVATQDGRVMCFGKPD